MGTYYKAVAATVTNTTTSNQFYLGIDTEILQRKASLLSGLDTSSSGLSFRANIGQALPAIIHNCMFFGMYDVILSIDTETKIIQAKF